MKDKLVRTNHKAGYYLAKRVALVACLLVAVSIMIALPISYGISVVRQNQIAQQTIEVER